MSNDERPIYESFQVTHHLYAGEYPGDKDKRVAAQKVQQIVSFGVRHFVDLTEEGELVPYAHLLPPGVSYHRFPIRDCDVPSSIEEAAYIVSRIYHLCTSFDGYVYLHCWGGVGRTGMMVACYLAETMEHPTYEAVMARLRKNFSMMPKAAHRVTPDTHRQELFIQDYVAGVEARREQRKELLRDSIRGCMMAGAAGDALGYPVEFMRLGQIRSRYGMQGIRQFELSNGKALVSDDTQMTLFTANGLLMGVTRWHMRGIGSDLADYCDGAYIDWYYTQTGEKPKPMFDNDFHYTWLRDLPELAHRRAPGSTCMSACESMMHRNKPQNDSKGCGGIMRVAPMGLFEAAHEQYSQRVLYTDLKLAEQGAQIARKTHLHPLGYLPAAMLTLLIAQLTPLTPNQAQQHIVELIHECLAVLEQMKEGTPKDKEYLRLITLNAIRLAKSDTSDDEAIEILGEGWVAEEAWAVSVFCAIRHIDNLREAIIAAVNHDGDSDSTGSITGNIMGAIYGYEAIRQERLFCPEGKAFEDTIELANLILALADDIFSGCPISEYAPIDTPEKKQWFDRYVHMQPGAFSR